MKAGYPEDRIIMNYMLPNGSNVVDIAILPPGLSKIPLMVITTKRNMIEGYEFLVSEQAEKIRKEYDCPGYIYCADEDILYYLDNTKAIGATSSIPNYEALKKQWQKKQKETLKKYDNLTQKRLEEHTYLSSLNLENFMVFRSAEFHFGSKLNIITGENGSGKSQLLKLIYSINRSFTYNHSTELLMVSSFGNCLLNVFKINNLKDLLSNDRPLKDINIHYILSGKNESAKFIIKTSNEKTSIEINSSNYLYNYNAENVILLPVNELLSIFPSFSSMKQIYSKNWPYDKTISDCIDYLGLPPIQSQGFFYKEIIQEVEKAIHGHIYLDEQATRFLMQMEKSKTVYEIPVVATGWRKMGQLLQLINTGAIYPGSILMWDEPDANLNPKLICLLAKVLLKLAQAGVQVFIATHSLFLLRELDMLVKSKTQSKQFASGDVRFFNLLDNGIVEQGDNEEDLENVLLLDESLKQSDRYLLEDY